jgi:hypothetical protein
MNQTAPAAQPASQALVVSGTFDNNTINAQLALAAQKCHLISSATSASLPPGCVVACSVVQVTPADVYDVGGGKKALLRTALLKIANAAGVCWNASASGRIDDRRHPYLVHYHAEGAWRGLDGQWLPVVGEVLLDLRDGSAAVAKILESARARGDGNVRVTAAEVGRIQVRDTRAKILEHAQSKAELRGIRKALAIRSYSLSELAAKPFCVFKPVWVGTDSPDDRAAIRESFLRGAAAMFGESAARRLAAAPIAPALPPASDFTADGEVIDEFEPEPAAAAPEPTPAPAPQAATSAAPASPAPETAPPTGPRSGLVIPGGRSKGTAIEDADDRDLTYWADRLEQGLADGSARDAARDEALARAMRAEQARRDEGR